MLQQIFSLLKEIQAEVADIRTTLHNLPVEPGPKDQELWDNSDAKRHLKVCDKTLYRWRKEQRVKVHIIGNKQYYLKADLIRLKQNL